MQQKPSPSLTLLWCLLTPNFASPGRARGDSWDRCDRGTSAQRWILQGGAQGDTVRVLHLIPPGPHYFAIDYLLCLIAVNLRDVPLHSPIPNPLRCAKLLPCFWGVTSIFGLFLKSSAAGEASSSTFLSPKACFYPNQLQKKLPYS